jgi:hypothetical protein
MTPTISSCCSRCKYLCKTFLQEKAVEATKKKKAGKEEKTVARGTGRRHSVSTALLKSAAEMIGTQSAMKSSRKTLRESTSHIPQKKPKRNKTT